MKLPGRAYCAIVLRHAGVWLPTVEVVDKVVVGDQGLELDLHPFVVTGVRGTRDRYA